MAGGDVQRTRSRERKLAAWARLAVGAALLVRAVAELVRAMQAG